MIPGILSSTPNTMYTTNVVLDGVEQSFGLYAGMGLPELEALLKSSFRTKFPPVGLQRNITREELNPSFLESLLHPEILEKATCILLVNRSEDTASQTAADALPNQDSNVENSMSSASATRSRNSSSSSDESRNAALLTSKRNNISGRALDDPRMKGLKKSDSKRLSFYGSNLTSSTVAVDANENEFNEDLSNPKVGDLQAFSIEQYGAIELPFENAYREPIGKRSTKSDKSGGNVAYGVLAPRSNDALSHSVGPAKGESLSSQEVAVIQNELKKNIVANMESLKHSSTCKNSGCTYAGCLEFKELMDHESNCSRKILLGCEDCMRLTNILSLHARRCRDSTCAILHCREYREHYITCGQCSDRLRMILSYKVVDDMCHEVLNDMYGCLQGTAFNSLE